MNDAIIAIGWLGLVCGSLAFAGILLRIVAMCGSAAIKMLEEED